MSECAGPALRIWTLENGNEQTNKMKEEREKVKLIEVIEEKVCAEEKKRGNQLK